MTSPKTPPEVARGAPAETAETYVLRDDVPHEEASTASLHPGVALLPPAKDPATAPGDVAASLPPEGRPWLVEAELLAGGGMGYVSRVHDKRLRRRVALKVLNATIAESGTSRRRFLEEAQITGQLDHPNIPPVHDLWVDARGNPSFTMKLLQGQTLGRLLRTRGPRERSNEELEELLRIFIKVCEAVAFAHSRGVIHRDLKPENIMVGSHGQVYVMDWGCALLLAGARPTDGEAVTVDRDPSQEALDPPGSVIGTYEYMAPEQAQALSAQIDEQTDVYLLGGILYELLTGVPPHRGDSVGDALRRANEGEVQDPQVMAGDLKLPPALCAIAMRALQRSPADRHHSVAELQHDVERVLRSGLWFAEASFPAGTLVVREGDAADAAYIITRGSCAVFRTVDGQHVPLRTLGPGEVFGETAIFTSRERTASVETVEAMTAIVVTRESLEREMATPWVFSFVRSLAERFLELEAELSAARRAPPL